VDATQESLRELQVEIGVQQATSFQGQGDAGELAPASASDFLQPFARRSRATDGGEAFDYRPRAAYDELRLDLDGSDDIEAFSLQNERMARGLNNIFEQLSRVRASGSC
jgi:hypothetical protein